MFWHTLSNNKVETELKWNWMVPWKFWRGENDILDEHLQRLCLKEMQVISFFVIGWNSEKVFDRGIQSAKKKNVLISDFYCIFKGNISLTLIAWNYCVLVLFFPLAHFTWTESLCKSKPADT